MSAQAYPLQWPDHIPRSKHTEASKFRTTFEQAVKNVKTSLQGFAKDSAKEITSPVLSSNVDFNPLAERTFSGDSGVAVWFTWDGLSVCIPCDRYHKPADNLQAIHHIIEARRVELRHGSLHLVRATFHGFKALPPPPGAKPKRPWWEVLQINRDAGKEHIEAAYKLLAKKLHPDVGGSESAFKELLQARDEATLS